MSIPKFIDAAQPAGIRSERETFIASAAVAEGDWVSFDLAKTTTDQVLYVKTAVATALGAAVCGVALAAAAADERVVVVTGGYVAKAKVAGTPGAGTLLSVDATDGTGSAAVATDNAIVCGQTTSAVSGGLASCLVFRLF
jgi:hypothetical protein